MLLSNYILPIYFFYFLQFSRLFNKTLSFVQGLSGGVFLEEYDVCLSVCQYDCLSFSMHFFFFSLPFVLSYFLTGTCLCTDNSPLCHVLSGNRASLSPLLAMPFLTTSIVAIILQCSTGTGVFLLCCYHWLSQYSGPRVKLTRNTW